MIANKPSANWKSRATLALVALVGVTAVWGYTFLVVQDAIADIPVMDFLAWRFLLASAVMIALRPACLRNVTRLEVLRGVGLGTVLALGYIAQTYGLRYTSAATSGFVTGMFVVFTPVMSWILLRRKTSRHTWMVVALATAGLALLTLNGLSVGVGEAVTLACAVFFAIHIVGLGEWSSQYDPYPFTLLQIGTVAVISLFAAVPGGVSLPPSLRVWAAVAITGVLATSVAFFVQTWALSLVSATRAAVVMTMEPVFAGLFAVLIGGNRLTPRNLVGAACILTAMLLISLRAGQNNTRLKA